MSPALFALSHPRPAQFRLGQHSASLPGATLARQGRRGHGLQRSTPASAASFPPLFEQAPVRVVIGIFISPLVAEQSQSSGEPQGRRGG